MAAVFELNKNLPLPVIILKTPKLERSRVLEATLKGKKNFQVNLLISTMAESLIDLDKLFIDYETEELKLLEGRELNPREIACAYSHNEARAIIANSLSGGIILEDDARLVNLDALYLMVSSFLRTKLGQKAILNLTGFRNNSVSSLNSHKIHKLFGIPNLAVGYALTPSAALELICSNSPIKYVADWPDTKCKYYVPLSPLVKHGDENNCSTIIKDKNDFRKTNKKILIKQLFLHLLSTRLTKKKIKLIKYLRYQFLRRIYWLVDSLILKLIIQIYK